MKRCPNCGKEFLTGSNYCPYCDTKITGKKTKFSGRIMELPNLEKIPLKHFIIPKLAGLLAIAVIAVVFACILSYI